MDCGHIDETSFWTALAYCEWKKGRLSDCPGIEEFPMEFQTKMKNVIASIGKQEIAASISLAHGSKKEWKSKITVLDCDISYQKKLPEFFEQYANPYVIVGYDGLDKELMERLMPFAKCG